MACRAKIGQASLEQLSGGQLQVDAAGEEKEGQEGGTKKKGGREEDMGAAAAAPKERTSQDALQAARQRYLERKQQNKK